MIIICPCSSFVLDSDKGEEEKEEDEEADPDTANEHPKIISDWAIKIYINLINAIGINTKKNSHQRF